jgi:formylglycine-generating enzyme required for sulfatase activity
LRGGSWQNYAGGCRSAYRGYADSFDRYRGSGIWGFRAARILP